MILLAIETSTARSSVALVDDGVVLADAAHEDPRGHGAFLGPAVRRCLDAVGGAAALDAVAVGTGPGLYTGIRVGMATAAALASARGLPVIGVGGLDVLARMAPGGDLGRQGQGSVVTTLDARRGQVFWAVHRPDLAAASDGEALRCVDGPHVGTHEQFAAAVARLATRGAVQVVGEVGTAAVVRPDAIVLARLAAERIAAVTTDGAGAASGALTQLAERFSPAALTAVYLRDADVRIGWNERGGVRAGGPA
jgi:tRNA threonylcarbamoyladenosine biosynthesis protein TsaB